MARRNGIWYEGRLIANRDQAKISRASTGKIIVDLVIAEQFQERNDRAPEEFKDPTRAADAYVNTYTAWHRLRIFGDDAQLKPLLTNPLFNHGAVVTVDASYTEEKPWEDRGGKVHAGRREQIFMSADDPGSIGLKTLDDGRQFGARDEWAKPLWDGVRELPKLGGGGPAAPSYSDNEGF